MNHLENSKMYDVLRYKTSALEIINTTFLIPEHLSLADEPV